MKIETVKKYSNAKFRRITGVKRETFDKTAQILGIAYALKHNDGGRKPKLIIFQLPTLTSVVPCQKHIACSEFFVLKGNVNRRMC